MEDIPQRPTGWLRPKTVLHPVYIRLFLPGTPSEVEDRKKQVDNTNHNSKTVLEKKNKNSGFRT